MKYERVLAEIYQKPWAILPEKFAAICEVAKSRAAGEKLSEREILDRIAPERSARAKRLEARAGATNDSGAVALIPIYGVIQKRMNLMSQVSGGTSIERLTTRFRQALADPTVKAIVFDVDSPGGGIEGVQELADEIYKSRGQKKTVAVANAIAASAAYWLASQAGEFVVIPSGQVGSIGVFTAHEDISQRLEKEGVKVSLISAGKYKTEGNPYEPLSDEGRAALQEKVNAVYDVFVKQVAKGRGVAQASVRAGFGQGRLVLAADAVKEGMADRIATLDEAIARLGGAGAPKRTDARSDVPQLLSDIQDGDPDPDDDDCNCSCEACESEACDACANAECADEACKAAGCPMQERAAAAARNGAGVARRRRDLDLRTRNF